MVANTQMPVVHDKAAALEVPRTARLHIAIEIPLDKLGDAIAQAPEGRKIALILNRKAWRYLEKEKVPRELAAEFDVFCVQTFAEALKGADIPAYIVEGARNLEDCLGEILHFWPDAVIIKVKG